jgi:hypothetical protein
LLSLSLCVNIRKAITAGFFMQVALGERVGNLLTLKGNQIR